MFVYKHETTFGIIDALFVSTNSQINFLSLLLPRFSSEKNKVEILKMWIPISWSQSDKWLIVVSEIVEGNVTPMWPIIIDSYCAKPVVPKVGGTAPLRAMKQKLAVGGL